MRDPISPARPSARSLMAVRRAPRCILAALIAAAVALLGIGVVHAQALVVEPNGCGPADSWISSVANAPLGFDFTAPCNTHDACYGAGLDRGSCDQRFYEDMSDVCSGSRVCEFLAWVHWQFVAKGGQGPYDKATRARLDDLVSALIRCNGDQSCEHEAVTRIVDEAFRNELAGCGGDAACEDEVIRRRIDSMSPEPEPTPDPTVEPDPAHEPPADEPGGDDGSGGGGDDYSNSEE